MICFVTPGTGSNIWNSFPDYLVLSPFVSMVLSVIYVHCSILLLAFTRFWGSTSTARLSIVCCSSFDHFMSLYQLSKSDWSINKSINQLSIIRLIWLIDWLITLCLPVVSVACIPRASSAAAFHYFHPNRNNVRVNSSPQNCTLPPV